MHACKPEFPNGAIRRTQMRGTRNSSSETLGLSGILSDSSAHPIECALFTAYYIDEEWLLSYINSRAKITLIAHNYVNTGSGHSSDKRITRVFPELPREDFQIMHTKIMLIYYRCHLRFVVLTGNLVKEEWTVMQNAVFIQDFKKDDSIFFPANEFSKSLAYALHDISAPAEIIAMMNGVDFSMASARIVTSVPTGGSRKQRNMDEYGMERLATIVRDMEIDKQNAGVSKQNIAEFVPNARLYCTGSSLGPVDNRWLCDMYLSAHGINHSHCKHPVGPAILPWELIDIGIAFHTQTQVDKCRYSDVGKEHIYMKSKDYFSSDFPKNSLVYLQPQVAKTLVHAKAILARFGEQQRKGWMYLGSHNFTPAAWGRLSVGRDSRSDSYFNNYELGVVFDDVVFIW
ncbi:hypothetical protein LPJ64_005470 [Coemansia asiatica]|uniref:Tyrosyl-DNA phosphodiesterase n=1 Tax=Coemansia asiatica TaxID=1052880 RepID=A0A9W7XEB8_9FUNG|nr:hypothetical protein LPJ64_005470 [Coemansia asiatica]